MTRANKFLSVSCPCGAEIGQPCHNTRTGAELIEPDYARTLLFFRGQEYLAKLQQDEVESQEAALRRLANSLGRDQEEEAKP